MRKATLKALKASIRKGQQIAIGKAYSRGVDNCPLCKRFGFTCRIRATLEYCPVVIETRHVGCLRTPYNTFERNSLITNNGMKASSKRSQATARNIVRFLQRLLPDEERS